MTKRRTVEDHQADAVWSSDTKSISFQYGGSGPLRTRRALTTAPTEAPKDRAPSAYKPRRHRQRLTDAEIKAAADRAQARSENRD